MKLKQLLAVMTVAALAMGGAEAQKKKALTPQEQIELAWETDTADSNY